MIRVPHAWVGLACALGTAGTACLDDDYRPSPLRCDTDEDPDPYSPYPIGAYSSGDVGALPWRGEATSYPNGREGFDIYSDGSTIECGSDKGRRSYLDVTAGCLHAAAMGDGAFHRAKVSLTDGGAFRAVALAYVNDEQVKWFDERSEYRFFYAGTTGGVFDGFKVFARYRTEDDLYVASWRMDGVVQIQKKQCGEYTVLARIEGVPPPTPTTWHRIRFDAIGDELSLYLDDTLALTAHSRTFSWGTVGIRIDGMTGTYLDDWHVF